MKKEVIAYKSPKSPISEVFKTLRTNIQFMNVNKKMQVLLLTSTFPGEGKSWVTSNLAVTFAQAGKKVIIIDSDMRKGRQYAIFGVSPTPGLSNFLSEVEFEENGRISRYLEGYIQETEVSNLHVITAGNVPPNPSELLVSGQMLKLVEELRDLYDVIIIDGTPSELVTDAVILSRIADSTIIVTAHKLTKKDALERVIKNIKNVGGRIAGVVINKVPVSAKKYGERYYYYGDDKNTAKKNNKSVDATIARQEEKIKKMYNEKIRIKKANKEELKRKKEKLNNMEKIAKVREIEDKIKENVEEEPININSYTGTDETVTNPNIQQNVSSDEKNDILKQINDFLDKKDM